MVPLSLSLSAPSHCHWRALFQVKSGQTGVLYHPEPRSHRASSRAQGHEGRTQPGSPHHVSLLSSISDVGLPCRFLFRNIFMLLKKKRKETTKKPFKVIGPKRLHQVAVKATHVYSLCPSFQLFSGTWECIYGLFTGGLATSQFDLQFHLGRLLSVVCRCGILKMTLCWEICSGFNFLRANRWSGIFSSLWSYRS